LGIVSCVLFLDFEGNDPFEDKSGTGSITIPLNILGNDAA